MSLETVQVSKGHARIQYIDTMKAWAILCVVMGHVLTFNLYGNDNHSLLFGLIYSFHLPLFALSSGFVTDISKFNFKRRIKIVYPLLLFGLSFTYFIGKNYSYFFLDEMKCGYWWLWMMAIFYVCLHIMQRFKIRVILGFVAFEILFQLLSRCLPYTYEAIFCLRSCADLWPWLCSGMLLKEHGWIRCFNLKWYLILALSVLWIFSYFINSAFSIKGYHYVVSISGVIFFTSLFCSLSNRCNFKMGGVIGRCTLQIYVLHYFLIRFLPLKHIGEYLKEYNLWIFDFIICPIIAFLVCWLCVMLSNGLQKIKVDWVFGK